MADYTHYGVAAHEWVEFEKSYKPFSVPPGTSMAQQKKTFNESRVRLFRSVLGPVAFNEDGVESEDIAIPASDGCTISARVYRPKLHQGNCLPLYIHLHGGGFHFGDLETEDVSCRLICLETTTIVLNVNYRHSPEWTFPTPVQDAWDAFTWITHRDNYRGHDPDRVFIGGTSAGASLACATTLREREQGGEKIKGLILTVPPTVHENLFPQHLIKDGCSSLEQNAEAPILPLSRLLEFHEMYKPEPKHRFFSPLLVDDHAFRHFPPTSVHVAGLDPLRDEGILFAHKLKRAGVTSKLRVYAGFPHAFMNLPQLRQSKKWRHDLYEDIDWLNTSLK